MLAGAAAALFDGRVPGRLKLIAMGLLVFILSPLNILGDIPLLGLVDDAALMSVVLVWFSRSSLPYLNTIEARPVARR